MLVMYSRQVNYRKAGKTLRRGCCLITFFAFWLVDTRGFFIKSKGLSNKHKKITQEQEANE